MAIDRNFGTIFASSAERTPWIQIDYGSQIQVHQIVIKNRGDCCGDRLANVEIFVTDTPAVSGQMPSGAKCTTFEGPARDGAWEYIPCDATMSGRYVILAIENPPSGYFNFAELYVYTPPGR